MWFYVLLNILENFSGYLDKNIHIHLSYQGSKLMVALQENASESGCFATTLGWVVVLFC